MSGLPWLQHKGENSSLDANKIFTSLKAFIFASVTVNVKSLKLDSLDIN